MWHLWIAAALSAGAVAFHGVVARRMAPRPVPGAGMRAESAQLLCWHGITMLFAIMATTLAAGALGRIDDDAIRLVGVIAASIAVLATGVAIRAGIAWWQMPPVWVLGAVALLALTGG